MRIVFTKSFWEMDFDRLEDPMAAFIDRVAQAGFDGTEMFLPAIDDDPARVIGLHEDAGLDHRIIDIVTEGDTPHDHLTSFDAAVTKALPFRPALINSHTGRDIFTFAENLNLYVHTLAVMNDVGVPIVHETHRTRPTYSAIDTQRYLTELPGLMLNADLSHWMVVHESDLADQDHNVELALARSRHIHARVGYEEGPQVSDPRSPEWKGHLDRHVELWQRVVDHCHAAGVDTLAITPEFGPPPYAHTLPGHAEPVANVWEINVFMKDHLTDQLTVKEVHA